MMLVYDSGIRLHGDTERVWSIAVQTEEMQTRMPQELSSCSTRLVPTLLRGHLQELCTLTHMAPLQESNVSR